MGLTTVYRFLIGRKTLFLLATLWLASASLLFVAGWLLGRSQSAPTIDQAQIDELLDEATAVRRTTRRAQTAESARRSPAPWRSATSSSSKVPAAASTSPSATPTTSTAASTSSTPAVSGAPEAATPTPSPPPASVEPASKPSSSAPTEAPPATAPPPTATNPPSATEPPAAVKQPAGTAQSSTFSLQVGAFASQENAETHAAEITVKGHRTYIVPVVDGARTLFTVRIGRYASRELALTAADDLRRRDGMSAVIRPVPAG